VPGYISDITLNTGSALLQLSNIGSSSVRNTGILQMKYFTGWGTWISYYTTFWIKRISGTNGADAKVVIAKDNRVYIWESSQWTQMPLLPNKLIPVDVADGDAVIAYVVANNGVIYYRNYPNKTWLPDNRLPSGVIAKKISVSAYPNGRSFIVLDSNGDIWISKINNNNQKLPKITGVVDISACTNLEP
jgi:hypothetical protein